MPLRARAARWRLAGIPSLAGLALLIAATRHALPSAQMLVGPDAVQILLPLKRFLADELAAGRLPIWYPYDGVGISFPGSFIGGLLDPLNLLLLAFRPAQALKWMTLLCLPMAALGLAYLGRALGLPRRMAAFSGLSYALSGLALSQTNTLCYLASIARIPWALGAAVRLGERPTLGRAAVLAIAVASLAWGGDPEEFLVASVVVAGLLLRRRRSWAHAIAAVGMTAGLTLAIVLPGVHQALQSTRLGSLGQEEALSWSLHPLRLLELALDSPFDLTQYRPELISSFGGQNGGFWSGSLYIGALLVFLAVLGLTSRGGRTGLWGGLAIVGVLGGWLALGRFGGLYAHIPLLMHFRYPEKLEVWVMLPVALFAGRGLLRVRHRLRLRPGIVFVAALLLASALALHGSGISFNGGLMRAIEILSLAAVLSRLLPVRLRRSGIAALALVDPALMNADLITVGSEAEWISVSSPVPEVGRDERLCVDLRFGGYDLPPDRQNREGIHAAARATVDSGLSGIYRIRSIAQQIPLESSALSSLCSVPDVCLDPCSRLVGGRWIFAPQQTVAGLMTSGEYREVRTLDVPRCSLLEDDRAAPYSAVLPALSYTDTWKTIVALHRGELKPGAQALIEAGDLPPGSSWNGRGEAPATRVRTDRIEIHTHADAPESWWFARDSRPTGTPPSTERRPPSSKPIWECWAPPSPREHTRSSSNIGPGAGPGRSGSTPSPSCSASPSSCAKQFARSAATRSP